MIYRNIKQACDKEGVSISKLERELGFARSSICKWNENIPSVDKVKKVADYLGTTVDFLLSDDKKQTVANEQPA